MNPYPKHKIDRRKIKEKERHWPTNYGQTKIMTLNENEK